LVFLQRALRPSWLLAAAGIVGLAAAAAARGGDAMSAAAQDWPPFVLVAGLLMIGLVADADGLFAAAGARLAGTTRSGRVLFAGAALLVSIVSATLNLDTSVAFLTPVLVHTARSRGEGEPAMLYGCLMLANAGSLLLPGSNLTNLIVLGHLHLTGGQFAARMWLPWVGAILVTAVVVAVAERQSVRPAAGDRERAPCPVLLAARAPSHPFELLVGLNLGPNLCITGSLAWLLWLRSARDAGARPSLGRASRLGVVVVPLSMVVAVAALAITARP
jgi:Na+/H+ antiporter NhaD/arsenite permease-like protein